MFSICGDLPVDGRIHSNVVVSCNVGDMNDKTRLGLNELLPID